MTALSKQFPLRDMLVIMPFFFGRHLESMRCILRVLTTVADGSVYRFWQAISIVSKTNWAFCVSLTL